MAMKRAIGRLRPVARICPEPRVVSTNILPSVAVVFSDDAQPDRAQGNATRESGIELIPRPIALAVDGSQCLFLDDEGIWRVFDVVYRVLGS